MIASDGTPVIEGLGREVDSFLFNGDRQNPHVNAAKAAKRQSAGTLTFSDIVPANHKLFSNNKAASVFLAFVLANDKFMQANPRVASVADYAKLRYRQFGGKYPDK